MKKRRTKKKRRTGARIGWLAAGVAWLGCLLTVQAAEKTRPQAAPGAMIAGTVFRESGLSLAGAEVSVVPASEEKGKRRVRPLKVVSDARGEFVVRLPAGPARYRVAASARGYQTAEQTVEIQGEERVDLSIVLQPSPATDKKAVKP